MTLIMRNGCRMRTRRWSFAAGFAFGSGAGALEAASVKVFDRPDTCRSIADAREFVSAIAVTAENAGRPSPARVENDCKVPLTSWAPESVGYRGRGVGACTDCEADSAEYGTRLSQAEATTVERTKGRDLAKRQRGAQRAPRCTLQEGEGAPSPPARPASLDYGQGQDVQLHVSGPVHLRPAVQDASPGWITVQALPFASLHAFELPAGPGGSKHSPTVSLHSSRSWQLLPGSPSWAASRAELTAVVEAVHFVSALLVGTRAHGAQASVVAVAEQSCEIRIPCAVGAEAADHAVQGHCGELASVLQFAVALDGHADRLQRRHGVVHAGVGDLLTAHFEASGEVDHLLGDVLATLFSAPACVPQKPGVRQMARCTADRLHPPPRCRSTVDQRPLCRGSS